MTRIARICTKHPDCNWRAFGDPKAVCPDHGKGKTQENHPYRGSKP